MSISLLSTLHRSLITLSALQMGLGPRATILVSNQVTEDDLRTHYADWQRLRVLHQAHLDRYEQSISPIVY